MKVGDGVAKACFGWEHGESKVSSVGGMHECTIGIADGDGRCSKTFVVERGVSGEEMTSAAGVGNGREGGTLRDGRM